MPHGISLFVLLPWVVTAQPKPIVGGGPARGCSLPPLLGRRDDGHSKPDGMLLEQGYLGLPLEFPEPQVSYFLQGFCLYKQCDEEANCKLHRPI